MCFFVFVVQWKGMVIKMAINASTPFKKILDFHEQTLGKNDAEKVRIAQSQNIDFNEYKRRITGKEKELEFFIK